MTQLFDFEDSEPKHTHYSKEHDFDLYNNTSIDDSTAKTELEDRKLEKIIVDEFVDLKVDFEDASKKLTKINMYPKVTEQNFEDVRKTLQTTYFKFSKKGKQNISNYSMGELSVLLTNLKTSYSRKVKKTGAELTKMYALQKDVLSKYSL